MISVTYNVSEADFDRTQNTPQQISHQNNKVTEMHVGIGRLQS